MSEAVAPPFSRLLSDERLTRRAVGGDERAFGAIFRRYHQSLYRFCLAILGNPDDASEALQNTMIKVLRALPGEERKIELKPWLYRIAHNESIDVLRRRRETRELDVEQVAPGYGLAEDAATRERLRRLIVDMRALPERQREVLVMRELAGLEFSEIGSALGTSGAVARQTLYEARQSLRQMEEGREMSCAAVAKALSDGDGRVTRRRDVRAHLRSCARCQAFREEIRSRERDLAALAPLPAVAAAGMLHGLVGSSQGAAGGSGLAASLGGGAAKTIGASAAAKGVATAAVVAAIGVTAADRSGAIHLGLPGEQAVKSAAPASGGDVPAPGGRAAVNDAADRRGVGAAGAATAGATRAGGRGGAAPARNAAPVVGATAPSGNAPSEVPSHRQAHEEVSAESQGPQVETPAGEDSAEHASGQDHEKQYPQAASDGHQTPSGHKPTTAESAGGNASAHGAGNASAHAGGNSAAHAATPAKPAHPETPASPASASHPKSHAPAGTPANAPPEEAPANPPDPAPEPPAPGPPPRAEESPGQQGASHSAEAPGKSR